MSLEFEVKSSIIEKKIFCFQMKKKTLNINLKGPFIDPENTNFKN
jgi:hypothetical protein